MAEQSPSETYKYKAFISYNHAADGKLASAIQSGLHRFNKPWRQMRALRAFCDKTEVAIDYALWPLIETALRQSEFFLLLASPKAAQSHWVRREIDFWLTIRPADKLLIILTDGKFDWDDTIGDFGWCEETAIPTNLMKTFNEEPRYLDLRWAKSSEDLSLRHPQFHDAIADISSTLQGVEKATLVSEDVRQFKKNRRMARAAIIMLLILSCVFVAAAVLAITQRNIALAAVSREREARLQADEMRQEAVSQRQVAQQKASEAEQAANAEQKARKQAQDRGKEAEDQRGMAEQRRKEAENQTRIALARQLAAQSGLMISQEDDGQQRGTLLAVESMRRFPSVEAEQSLRRALQLLPRLITRLTHGGSVESAIFSPDGRSVATASEDKTARVWDVATGAEIARMSHGGEVEAIAFSKDGRQLASVSNDGVSQVWEARSGHLIYRFALGDTHGGRFLFSRNGRYLVMTKIPFQSGNEIERGDTAQLWDVARGERIASLQHEDKIEDLTFAADEQYMTTVSLDGTARIWETSSGKEIKRLTHNGGVHAVAFSSDGEYLATTCDDGVARVWEWATDREAARVKQDEPCVGSIVFSPDRRYLITGSCFTLYNSSKDKQLRIWDLTGNREVARIRDRSGLDSLVFSPDGSCFATSAGFTTAQVWETATGREISRIIHEKDIKTLAFSPDGRYIITASDDETACVWETISRNEIVSVSQEDSVKSVSYSPDGRFFATGSADDFGPMEGGQRDHTARIWESYSGREVWRLPHKDNVNAIAFSPDGQFLATGSGSHRLADYTREGNVLKDYSPQDNNAHIWNLANGKEILRLGHKSNVTAVAFGLSGRQLVTGAMDGAVRIWDLNLKAEAARIQHESNITSLTVSPDGRHLATVSGYFKIRIWDLIRYTEVASLSDLGLINGVTFSPDGRYLGIACNDGVASLWEYSTGRMALRLKHRSGLSSIAFTRDGQYLATGTFDGTSLIWRISEGREVARVAHKASVEAVAFSPDGTRLATASQDKTAKEWLWQPGDLMNEACSRLTHNLSLEEWRRYIGGEHYRKTCNALPW